MLRQPRRLLSAALAIVLGIAFVTATLGLGASLDKAVRTSAAAPVEGSAAVITSPSVDAEGRMINNPSLATPDTVAAIRRLPGVSGVRADVETVVEMVTRERSRVLIARGVPELGPRTHLVEGRMPTTPDEVALDPSAAQLRGVAPGQSIELLLPAPAAAAPAAPPPNDSDDEAAAGPPPPPPVTRTVKVVGIVKPGPEVITGPAMPMVFAADVLLFEVRGKVGYDSVYVRSDQDPDDLSDAIAELPGVKGSTMVVRTGEDEIEKRVEDYSRGSQVLTGMLLGFAGVSMFVSALVIANTFAILVAQRTRQLALLRCIGATRGQVFRDVLREAVLLGLAASAVGVGLGIGLAAIGVHLSKGTMPMDGLAVNATVIVVPLLLGLLITVVAAVAPAIRATRVAPLAALRPVLPSAGRQPWVRIGLGMLLTAGGAAALISGARGDLGLGMLGGVVSFTGVLLLGSWLIPLLVRPLQPVFGALFGPTGSLAVANSRRNPRRAAATASALLVGVTLITMMVVAAGTGQTSTDRALEREFPFDAQAQTGQPLSPLQLEQMRQVPGVAGVSPIRSAPVEVRRSDGSARSAQVMGVAPQVRGVLSRPAVLDGLADDVLVVGSGLKPRLSEGERVTVVNGDRRVELRVHLTNDAKSILLATEATMGKLGVPHPTGALIQYAKGTDIQQTEERLGGIEGLQVGGPALARAELGKIISTVLWIVTALLAVAVVIALVGVGNTLGLSVLERAQESGLLRALGLTRGQLRAMVGLEALVLAGVATVLGVGLGIGYGIAGAYALIGREMQVAVSVPWPTIGLVCAVALLAGLLASVLPAGRAARVSPAAAMVTE
ncbi:FtsX-like permease family protein [Naumannella sp. ID2617S]|nr:FtsX-like permease family protein [Naumannella sp. ID2617S]